MVFWFWQGNGEFHAASWQLRGSHSFLDTLCQQGSAACSLLSFNTEPLC